MNRKTIIRNTEVDRAVRGTEVTTRVKSDEDNNRAKRKRVKI
jgi:hypothetical protein